MTSLQVPEWGDDDDDLNEVELEYFRLRLLEERAAVKTKLDRHVSEAVYDLEALPADIDHATRESEQILILVLLAPNLIISLKITIDGLMVV